MTSTELIVMDEPDMRSAIKGSQKQILIIENAIHPWLTQKWIRPFALLALWLTQFNHPSDDRLILKYNVRFQIGITLYGITVDSSGRFLLLIAEGVCRDAQSI